MLLPSPADIVRAFFSSLPVRLTTHDRLVYMTPYWSLCERHDPSGPHYSSEERFCSHCCANLKPSKNLVIPHCASTLHFCAYDTMMSRETRSVRMNV